MEIVTLAQVVLNRIGSASHRSFGGHKQISVTRQTPDFSPESLMEIVKLVAEENGEPRDRLHGLSQIKELRRNSAPQGTIVFDLQTPNVQHSSPYATVVAFPALKANGRYYKLEEVKV